MRRDRHIHGISSKYMSQSGRTGEFYDVGSQSPNLS